MTYQIIHCSYGQHAESILEIYNEVIETSTAMYDYKKRTMEDMEQWFDSKIAKDYPVIGLISHDKQLMAFGTYGPFRIQPAYQYTVEHSIYIHRSFRSQGYGDILLKSLIKSAQVQQYHAMIAAIDDNNIGSIKLHEKNDFRHVGTLPEVGYKFDRWLNLVLYQRLLSTPVNPITE